jgi:hypothetical protein
MNLYKNIQLKNSLIYPDRVIRVANYKTDALVIP